MEVMFDLIHNMGIAIAAWIVIIGSFCLKHILKTLRYWQSMLQKTQIDTIPSSMVQVSILTVLGSVFGLSCSLCC